MQTDTKLPANLRADCSRCCALCCVAPPFDAAQGFGFDKPAHTPCSLLRDDLTCSIHRERIVRGFVGCTVFDCYGAGQRVTQLFGGASWRDGPEIARRMFHAYSRLRVLHELLAALSIMASRVGYNDIGRALHRRMRAIERACELGIDELERLDIESIKRATVESLRLTRTPQT